MRWRMKYSAAIPRPALLLLTPFRLHHPAGGAPKRVLALVGAARMQLPVATTRVFGMAAMVMAATAKRLVPGPQAQVLEQIETGGNQ